MLLGLTLPGSLWAITPKVHLAGIEFNYLQVPRYKPSVLENAIALRCDYAQATLLNASDWDSTRRERRVLQVDLVFTLYPHDTARWKTPFTQLMTARIAALQALDSQFRLPGIKWNLVAQTACSNASHAADFFHGFSIKYNVNADYMPNLTPQILTESRIDHFKKLIRKGAFQDSVIFKTLKRHPDWHHLVVVLDWTASMYDYGAQVLRWHAAYAHQGKLSQLVLFNDGDDFIDKKTRGKPLGRTGGIYECDPTNFTEVVEVMEEAMQFGDGGETAENNLEALLYAMRRHGVGHRLVMIADNHSPVRDMKLLGQLYQPVDVILCGAQFDEPNSDYVTIAWKTGGSIQTLEQEFNFTQPAAPVPASGLLLGPAHYYQQAGRLVAGLPH